MKIPRLAQNSAIYTILMIFQKGIGFVLLPLYTSYLSPTDYGIQAVVVSISSFLSMLLAFDIDSAARRYYYIYNEDKNKAKTMYGTAAIVILLNSFLLGGITILLHNVIITPFLGEVDFYPYVFLGLLFVLVNPLYLLYQSYLQTIQDGVTYGINSFIYTALYICINILLLVYFKLGVLSILYSQLIVAVVFFIYVSIRFLPTLKLGIDKPFLKEALKYSLPLIPHTLANWSNDTLDKLIVNKIRNAADTGIFGLAQQYSSVVSIASNAVNQAYLPWFMKQADKNEYQLIKDVAWVSFTIICLFATFFSLYAKEILGLMISNPQYDDVYILVPYLVFAYVFKTIYFYFVDVLYLKDTKVIFTITWTTVLFGIGANLILIPKIGIIGAAIACTITFFVKSVMALLISSQRNKKIRFDWVKMYLLAITCFAIVLYIIYFVEIYDSKIVMLIKSLMFSVLAILMIAANKKYVYHLKAFLKK